MEFKVHCRIAVLLCCAGLLSACKTRSISDSSYRRHDPGTGFYRGEITELEVLGSAGRTNAESAYIPVTVKRGERLLVIQSGALLPDEAMTRELERYFSIASFSGIPSGQNEVAYAERLRNAALNGGCTRILVYWGILESARRDEATKIISWVPVVGQVVPDSTQTMRIRLKGFLVDATNGHWSMITADGFHDERISASIAREASDQAQVIRLKEAAYRNLVSRLL